MGYLTGIKDFFFELMSPKTSISFKKMRLLARSPKLRERYANKLPKCKPTKEVQQSKWLTLKDENKLVLESLYQKGYAEGINLTPEAIEELIIYCDNKVFTPDRDVMGGTEVQFSDKNAPGVSSIYSLMNPHNDSKVVQDLVELSPLKSLAQSYLGAMPVLMNSQIWYTFPIQGKANHHNFGFHYDVDDYKFLKFFFYLDKVDSDTGPHIIISGTHNESSAFKYFNRRISNNVAQKRYADKIVEMLGGAGAGFAEDTFCYHKGCFPNKRRLILQIQFGISIK
ncbi:hypothetical protein [Pseudoalteromonas sp. R86517]|uniref:hypothetical protein n=1 Tax=Pseudoalteromonas sp. R86517 TaxID=3093857 RepID=UPI003670E7F7